MFGYLFSGGGGGAKDNPVAAACGVAVEDHIGACWAMKSTLTPIVLVICIGAIALNFVVVASILIRMKNVQPDEWIRMGRPDAILNNGIKNGLLVSLYIFSSKHKLAQDKRLTAYVWASRIVTVIALVLALWLVTAGSRVHLN